MISDDEITVIGRFNKPHGINGEISATLDYDVDPEDLYCLIVKIDNINVPFFIKTSRPRSASTWLLSIDGYDSDTTVNELSNHDIYALQSDVSTKETEEDGLYVSDMLGFTILSTADGKEIGTIKDIDDSTDNILFIVETPAGKTAFIPAADDLIDSLDIDGKKIGMTIPDGLLDL